MISIPVDTASIDAGFAKLIVESKLGAAISRAIEDSLKPTYDTGRKIEGAVTAAVHEQISIIVRRRLEQPDIQEQLQQVIASHITSEFLSKLVTQAMEANRRNY